MVLFSWVYLVLDIFKLLFDCFILVVFFFVIKGWIFGEVEKFGFLLGLGKVYSIIERWVCLGEGIIFKFRIEC